MLSQFKVNELKELFSSYHIAIPPKSKKSDLIASLKEKQEIATNELVKEKIDENNSRFGYELYSLFMRTMVFRGKNYHDTKRANAIGVKKFKVMHVFDEDKEFVEMALKRNPDAIHPVFPSDMSIKQVVIDFNDL